MYSERTAYLWVIAVLHLIVEHVEVGFGHRFLVSLLYRCDVGVVRFFRVPEGEEITSLHQRCNKLRVAQRLDAGVFRIDRVLDRALPIRVLVHHLNMPVIFFKEQANGQVPSRRISKLETHSSRGTIFSRNPRESNCAFSRNSTRRANGEGHYRAICS